jgi:hypothetical protein
MHAAAPEVPWWVCLCVFIALVRSVNARGTDDSRCTVRASLPPSLLAAITSYRVVGTPIGGGNLPIIRKKELGAATANPNVVRCGLVLAKDEAPPATCACHTAVPCRCLRLPEHATAALPHCRCARSVPLVPERAVHFLPASNSLWIYTNNNKNNVLLRSCRLSSLSTLMSMPVAEATTLLSTLSQQRASRMCHRGWMHIGCPCA